MLNCSGGFDWVHITFCVHGPAGGDPDRKERIRLQGGSSGMCILAAGTSSEKGYAGDGVRC